MKVHSSSASFTATDAFPLATRQGENAAKAHPLQPEGFYPPNRKVGVIGGASEPSKKASEKVGTKLNTSA